MTKMIVAPLLLLSSSIMAQIDSVEIKTTIQTFFKGMHQSDTALIKTSLDSTCYLHSVMQKKDGSTLLQKENIDGFLQQVAALKGQVADEQLLHYDIKVDGALAIAWTPYLFYFNGRFSHCGVNVFTLIKRMGSWKIMGITDTRRKQGCNEQP